MGALLAIALWLLVLALVTIVVIIATPTVFNVHLSATPVVNWQISMRPLFGLIPRIRLGKNGAVRRTKPKSPAPTVRRVRRKRLGRGRQIAGAIPNLVADVLGQIKLAALSLDCEFGLDDPSDTGRVAGIALPLQYAFPQSATCAITFRPDFTARCFKAEVLADFQVTIARLIIPLMRFAWHGFRPWK